MNAIMTLRAFGHYSYLPFAGNMNYAALCIYILDSLSTSWLISLRNVKHSLLKLVTLLLIAGIVAAIGMRNRKCASLSC